MSSGNKVLVLHPSLEVGGAETQLRHLLEQYDRESVELILVLFSDWSCATTRFASNAGIRLVRLTSTKFDNFLIRQIRLIKVIKNVLSNHFNEVIYTFIQIE